MSTEASARGRERIGGVMSSYVYCATCGEEKADVDACTCSDCAEDYDRITRGQIADLKRQLDERETQLETARKALHVADRIARDIQGLLYFHPDALQKEAAEQLLSQWKAARDAALAQLSNPAAVVRTDHEYDQNPFYTGPGCAVCGLPTEAHAEGAKKLEERDRAVREEVIRVLVEADTNCEMYAAIECIRREFGLEG